MRDLKKMAECSRQLFWVVEKETVHDTGLLYLLRLDFGEKTGGLGQRWGHCQAYSIEVDKQRSGHQHTQLQWEDTEEGTGPEQSRWQEDIGRHILAVAVEAAKNHHRHPVDPQLVGIQAVGKSTAW